MNFDETLAIINIMEHNQISYNFFSRYIPRVGDFIRTSRHKNPVKVTCVQIDYSQIDPYQGEGEEGAGGVMVLVYIE